MNDDFAFAGALEQRRRIAAKEVSPRELTALYLERIERLDRRLNCYLTVTREGALRAAQAAEDAVMDAGGAALGPCTAFRCRSRTPKTPAGCARPRVR